jgi:2-polyprenyl-3-methyl-5-hydroxy-6-metoxy-1,4-benzoquinol methylase
LVVASLCDKDEVMSWLLATRNRHPEWMDEPGIDVQLHLTALRGLERINVVSGTVRAVWRPLERVARRTPSTPLTVLDVASGAGDLAIGLARRARAKGVKLLIDGCDISPTAIAHASRRARERGQAVRFFQHDAFTPLERAYDVVICSLFLHHLDDEQVVRLLRALAAAARSTVIVSDLERSATGMALAWLGTRVLTRSPVVHVDGPRSVRAAFTRGEAAGLAARAGLTSYTIRPHWPCRWLLVAEGAA